MIYKNVGELLKEQALVSLGPEASVQQAAELMAEHRVGAIAVVESEQLVGLFTERDLLNRVVAASMRPAEVALREVMTGEPVTVDADATLVESLSVMFAHKFRHLPVLEDEKVVGVLSCRDIPADYWLMHDNWVSAHSELNSGGHHG